MKTFLLAVLWISAILPAWGQELACDDTPIDLTEKGGTFEKIPPQDQHQLANCYAFAVASVLNGPKSRILKAQKKEIGMDDLVSGFDISLHNALTVPHKQGQGLSSVQWGNGWDPEEVFHFLRDTVKFCTNHSAETFLWKSFIGKKKQSIAITPDSLQMLAAALSDPINQQANSSGDTVRNIDDYSLSTATDDSPLRLLDRKLHNSCVPTSNPIADSEGHQLHLGSTDQYGIREELKKGNALISLICAENLGPKDVATCDRGHDVAIIGLRKTKGENPRCQVRIRNSWGIICLNDSDECIRTGDHRGDSWVDLEKIKKAARIKPYYFLYLDLLRPNLPRP